MISLICSWLFFWSTSNRRATLKTTEIITLIFESFFCIFLKIILELVFLYIWQDKTFETTFNFFLLKILTYCKFVMYLHFFENLPCPGWHLEGILWCYMGLYTWDSTLLGWFFIKKGKNRFWRKWVQWKFWWLLGFFTSKYPLMLSLICM